MPWEDLSAEIDAEFEEHRCFSDEVLRALCSLRSKRALRRRKLKPAPDPETSYQRALARGRAYRANLPLVEKRRRRRKYRENKSPQQLERDKARDKVLKQKPEYKAKQKVYNQARYQTDAYRSYGRTWQKAYRKRRKLEGRPVKDRTPEQQKAHRRRRKARELTQGFLARVLSLLGSHRPIRYDAKIAA